MALDETTRVYQGALVPVSCVTIHAHAGGVSLGIKGARGIAVAGDGDTGVSEFAGVAVA